MTTRTFKQYGQGYGATPATIAVTIDGVEIFNGDVPTLNEPVPVKPIVPSENLGVEIYSWTNDVTFQGTNSLQITVANGTFLMTDSLANYFKYVNPPLPDASSGPDNFIFFYDVTIDGNAITDPLTDVSIDGVARTVTRPEGELGQWCWVLGAGQVLTATINVIAGYESTNIYPAPV
jgi:hypothetical protein